MPRNRDQQRLDAALAVVLRTPGLFIIEYWWQNEKNNFLSFGDESNYILTILNNIALINGFFILLLPISCIRSLYIHFICGALLLSAHFLSHYWVRDSNGDYLSQIDVVDRMASSVVHNSAIKQISLLAVHVIIAGIVSLLLQGPRRPVVSAFACYSLPVIARIVDFSSESIEVIHHFSTAFVVITLVHYGYNQFYGLFNSFKGAFNDLLSETRVNGFLYIIVLLWKKLFVPTHFLLFWCIAFLCKIYENIFVEENSQDIYGLILSSASSLCTSPLSLVSTAVTVTYISYFTLCGIKLYLWGKPDYVGRQSDIYFNQIMLHQAHSGWEEGLITFLLAVLTGITNMQPPARMAVLTIILFVVLSSLLESMLEIAEPVILSLSTYHGRNIFHHVKVLLLCAFLFFFPLHVSWVLANLFPVDFWMAVVISTSLLTSAQVLDLVVVHCLLWYDAVRHEPWAPLDEMVYYVRSATKVIEFIVASSVVFVGIFEGISNKWNWTNAFILIIHCYFNVMQRFQAGYKSFIQRREAIAKSARLPTATKEQLKQHNDVCAICYIDMINEKESVIIPCQHFFHRICLRRWLCFQESCPLCSARVTLGEPKTSDAK
ncbi:RING finger protein 145 [Tetranychus urticae]|uniref:RING-type domain-containing protein n=1 Tax=Tetranychus urticae TaxID=32264 RepID=T1KA25_TETUR|nr:RING finger protein 145 [Tetranychus urticae]